MERFSERDNEVGVLGKKKESFRVVRDLLLKSYYMEIGRWFCKDRIVSFVDGSFFCEILWLGFYFLFIC